MAHEREPVPGRDAGPSADAIGRGTPWPVRSTTALDGDPPVVRGLGRLDAERGVVAHAGQPLHGPFGTLGRDRIRYPSPADGHEEEHRPEHGPEPPDEVPHGRQFPDGLDTHRGVDPQWEARRPSGLGGPERRLEPPLLPPERVVGGGGPAVDAECHPSETRVGEGRHRVRGERRRLAGRQRHPEADVGSVIHEVDGVVPGERVAARQDDQLPLAEPPGLLQEPSALGGRQFAGMATRLRVRSTVLAGQFARLRDFPDEDERPPRRVDLAWIHTRASPGRTATPPFRPCCPRVDAPYDDRLMGVGARPAAENQPANVLGNAPRCHRVSPSGRV